ncbi:hypothetical protein Hanom_Chr15g01360611 [Helianthus anomalus]
MFPGDHNSLMMDPHMLQANYSYTVLHLHNMLSRLRFGWLILHHVVMLIAERHGGTCTNQSLSRLFECYVS